MEIGLILLAGVGWAFGWFSGRHRGRSDGLIAVIKYLDRNPLPTNRADRGADDDAGEAWMAKLRTDLREELGLSVPRIRGL